MIVHHIPAWGYSGSAALPAGFFQCVVPEASSLRNFFLSPKGAELSSGVSRHLVKMRRSFTTPLSTQIRVTTDICCIPKPRCYIFLHVDEPGETTPTSQESPVYWGGQEHCSTVFPGPPVPSRVVSSRPTSPKLSRWL